MIEENFYSSSMGNKISSVISQHSKNIDFLHIAIDDEIKFHYDNRDNVLTEYSLDKKAILDKVTNYFKINN